jgi:Do/DeqQ family serine protease
MLTALAGGIQPAAAQEPNPTLSSLQQAFAKVGDEVEPAVCTIISTKAIHLDGLPGQHDAPNSRLAPRHTTGTGSGVIIDKAGWILTNDHVVGGADHVTVRLHDGHEYVGAVRRDVQSDLALVKINPTSPLVAAKLGDSDKIRIGYWAIAIGSPFRYEGSFSVGVISSLHRTQTIMDLSSSVMERFYPDMLQTDAAINPGNSGGPLCNLEGEVIGINTAIESEGSGGVGIGFAIPINSAKFVISQLLSSGHVNYGYLGVSPTSVTPRLADALKAPYGALIDQEPPTGTPAAAAGIQAGDVIVSIDGKPVHDEIELRARISQITPGTVVKLAVIRDGETHALTATLASAPERTAERTSTVSHSQLGIEVEALTPKVALQADVPAKTQGVYVRSVAPDGAASQVEQLLEGSILLKVNGTDVTSVETFQAATANLKSGDNVRLIYLWRRQKRFALVTLE